MVRLAILLASAALLASPARAQTYSTICGPVRLLIPNATLAAGTFQRVVRCGYTLASTAIFLQSFTLLNPQSALVTLVSARDANCEQPFMPYAPTSDNALGITTSQTTFPLVGQPQTATGDSTGEPRVCIYVGCVSGTCNTQGLGVDSYLGKRQTAPASGGSSSSSSSSAVGGAIGGVIMLLVLCSVVAFVYRCKREQREREMALQMQRQAQIQQMASAQPQVMVQGFPQQQMAMGMGGAPVMMGGQPYANQVRLMRATTSRMCARARKHGAADRSCPLSARPYSLAFLTRPSSAPRARLCSMA